MPVPVQPVSTSLFGRGRGFGILSYVTLRGFGARGMVLLCFLNGRFWRL